MAVSDCCACYALMAKSHFGVYGRAKDTHPFEVPLKLSFLKLNDCSDRWAFVLVLYMQNLSMDENRI